MCRIAIAITTVRIDELNNNRMKGERNRDTECVCVRERNEYTRAQIPVWFFKQSAC